MPHVQRGLMNSRGQQKTLRHWGNKMKLKALSVGQGDLEGHGLDMPSVLCPRQPAKLHDCSQDPGEGT